MCSRSHLASIWLLLVLFGTICQSWPVTAQMPDPAAETSQPEAILRVTVAEVTVQGDQTPEALREALHAILPTLAACLQTEYQRLGKVPARLTVRLNISGTGKVVWTKLIDPPLKSLEGCLGKALTALRLPSTGSSLSRATAVLECRTDHLLTP